MLADRGGGPGDSGGQAETTGGRWVADSRGSRGGFSVEVLGGPPTGDSQESSADGSEPLAAVSAPARLTGGPSPSPPPSSRSSLVAESPEGSVHSKQQTAVKSKSLAMPLPGPLMQTVTVDPRQLLRELSESQVREARLEEQLKFAEERQQEHAAKELVLQQQLTDEKVQRASAEAQAGVLRELWQQERQQERPALPAPEAPAKPAIMAIQDAVSMKEEEDAEEKAGIWRATILPGSRFMDMFELLYGFSDKWKHFSSTNFVSHQLGEEDQRLFEAAKARFEAVEKQELTAAELWEFMPRKSTEWLPLFKSVEEYEKAIGRLQGHLAIPQFREMLLAGLASNIGAISRFHSLRRCS